MCRNIFLFFVARIQPLNWSPNCLKYLQSVYLNVNIRVLDSQEILKYATTSANHKCEHLMRQCLMENRQHALKILPSIAVADDWSSEKPKSGINDDERHMKETLIR